MKLYTFTALITPESKESGIYMVSIPAFPEICTFGSSFEEARFMAQDALELVILSRLESGEPMPSDKKPSSMAKAVKMEQIIVSVVHQISSAPASYVKSAVFHTA